MWQLRLFTRLWRHVVMTCHFTNINQWIKIEVSTANPSRSTKVQNCTWISWQIYFWDRGIRYKTTITSRWHDCGIWWNKIYKCFDDKTRCSVFITTHSWWGWCRNRDYNTHPIPICMSILQDGMECITKTYYIRCWLADNSRSINSHIPSSMTYQREFNCTSRK